MISSHHDGQQSILCILYSFDGIPLEGNGLITTIIQAPASSEFGMTDASLMIRPPRIACQRPSLGDMLSLLSSMGESTGLNSSEDER